LTNSLVQVQTLLEILAQAACSGCPFLAGNQHYLNGLQPFLESSLAAYTPCMPFNQYYDMLVQFETFFLSFPISRCNCGSPLSGTYWSALHGNLIAGHNAYLLVNQSSSPTLNYNSYITPATVLQLMQIVQQYALLYPTSQTRGLVPAMSRWYQAAVNLSNTGAYYLAGIKTPLSNTELSCACFQQSPCTFTT
jgi:hypothetical protein